MKKYILAAVLVLWAVSGWCADFYCNAITGNDAWDGTSAIYTSGTTGPVKTIVVGASLMDGSDTLHIANGTYVETANILWPNGGGNTISGDSKTGVIVDLTSKTTGNWVQASGSSDDGGKIEKMTVKNLQVASAYLFSLSDCDNFTISNIKAKDNERLFSASGGSTGTLIEYFESAGIRNTDRSATFNTTGATTCNINYSIFRPSENYLANRMYFYNTSASINIKQSYFSGALTATHLQLAEEITLNAKNTAFVGNGNSGAFGGLHINGSCTNVTLTNCYSTNNFIYNMDSEIVTGFTINPIENIGFPRYGILLLSVDDTNNWDYAKLVAGVANARGHHITFYVHTQSLPAVGVGGNYAGMPLTELKDFLDAGNYVGCHSETHPTDITIDADNLPTSGLWDTEITVAKAKLEAYVKQISGYESWSCRIWASPGNKGSSALADRLKTEGFEFGRMGDINDGEQYLLSNLAIFTTKPIRSGYMKTAQDEQTISTNNIKMLSEHFQTVGCVGELYLHSNDETYDDPESTGLVEMFNALEATGLLLMNADEFLDWLDVNATYTDDDGNAARWSVTFEVDSFNGRLKNNSDCINNGANDDILYGEPDFYGKYSYLKNNIGPDQKAGYPSVPRHYGMGRTGFGVRSN